MKTIQTSAVSHLDNNPRITYPHPSTPSEQIDSEEMLANQSAAAQLVWSHLVHHGCGKAAMAFLKQWHGLDNNSSYKSNATLGNFDQIITYNFILFV